MALRNALKSGRPAVIVEHDDLAVDCGALNFEVGGSICRVAISLSNRARVK
ncbi:hypothetical protein [Mesorhizobium sp. Root695]|uniref:hypothetical protein n=1 Tax=Mesorhizobium sp. Root695 TaxID=1736589 RepID=UPI000A846D1B|nr:hypothetical protein [Mesorhizobium sp. Root695]